MSTQGVHPIGAATPFAIKPNIVRGRTPTGKILHPISERCPVPSQQVGYSLHARVRKKLLSGACAGGPVFAGVHQERSKKNGENSNSYFSYP